MLLSYCETYKMEMPLGYVYTIQKEYIRDCCGKFYPKDIFNLDLKGYSKALLEYGFCPHCSSFVVEVCKLNYDGTWEIEKGKRKKAQNLFAQYQNRIIDNLSNSRIKHGSKSNMGFRYGKNVEVKNCKGKVTHIRRYAVDFNETASLII